MKKTNPKKGLLAKAQKRKNNIGIKNESSLHRTLKYQYAGPGGKTEAEVGSFVADGINKNGEYIEVQTGSFAPLKKKVKEFAKYGKVRIIHPIAIRKIIEVYDTKEKLLYRRKSPVKSSKWDIFDALLSAPELPLVKGLTIEIVLADITEKRIKDGKGSWRRKGISKLDKELAAYHESIIFAKKSDYMRHFIPFKKEEEFTVAALSKQTNIKIDMARKALYVLTKMKLIKRIGKKGNAWVYVRG
ncbi:MAG: hypothetical protein FWD47_14695 [Treponema sp.]|nr:hypothetical protein [Treponema sp.]